MLKGKTNRAANKLPDLRVVELYAISDSLRFAFASSAISHAQCAESEDCHGGRFGDFAAATTTATAATSATGECVIQEDAVSTLGPREGRASAGCGKRDAILIVRYCDRAKDGRASRYPGSTAENEPAFV